MKKLMLTTFATTMTFCGILAFSSSAAAEGIGFGLKAGTLGGGVEITKGFSETFNGRLGFNSFTLDESDTESGITYDIDLELSNITLLIDWHPTGGSFRASAGLVSNGNELKMQAAAASSYDIGGTSYTSAQIGTLTGLVDFEDWAPYLGIGWGNAVEEGQNLTFSFDIGVLFQGSPNVNLDYNGSGASGLDASIQAEEQQLEADLDEFDVYPVLSLGVAWQF